MPRPASNAPPASQDVDRCVETRTIVFRAQRGEEEVITADQLSEWEAECRSGK